jgi:plasmid segregation protein ParM
LFLPYPPERKRTGQPLHAPGNTPGNTTGKPAGNTTGKPDGFEVASSAFILRKEVRMFIVDLGFSSAKWLHVDKKGTVRSCFRKSKSDVEGYLYRGDRYLVGERALLETGSRYLRTVEELVDLYPLLVSVCAHKADISQDDTIVVGLPYDYWKEEVTKARKGAANSIDSLRNSLKHIAGDSAVDFGQVIIFPQGLGGIKTYLNANPSSSGNILAVDIGFNTVIYTLYSCAQGEILTGRTFYKKGIHDMAVNNLLPEIQGHIQGKTLTPLEIDYTMRAGMLQVGFDRIDITPEIEEAARTYVNDLLGLVMGDLKAHGGVVVFDTVLFFGGGARLLNGKVESSRVNVVVMEDPEFANASGFRIKAEQSVRGNDAFQGGTQN